MPALTPRFAALLLVLDAACPPPPAVADEPFACDPDGLARLDAAIEKAVGRSFGCDIASPHSRPRGAHFSDKSYGHTGWTGPSVWINPKAGMLVLFLTNRNHPSERTGISDLREAVGTLAAEAAGIGVSGTSQEPASQAAP